MFLTMKVVPYLMISNLMITTFVIIRRQLKKMNNYLRTSGTSMSYLQLHGT